MIRNIESRFVINKLGVSQVNMPSLRKYKLIELEIKMSRQPSQKKMIVWFQKIIFLIFFSSLFAHFASFLMNLTQGQIVKRTVQKVKIKSMVPMFMTRKLEPIQRRSNLSLKGLSSGSSGKIEGNTSSVGSTSKVAIVIITSYSKKALAGNWTLTRGE